MNIIGRQIKAARKKCALTQAQLAEKAGMSRSYLAGVEQGYYNPSVKTLMSISKSCNVDLNFLVGMTETSNHWGRCVMTVGELLSVVRIWNQSAPARYSDGSGGGDHFLRGIDMEAVKITPAEIPALELQLLCLSLAGAAERYFSVPEHEAAFQAWLAEREKEDGAQCG